MKQFRFNALAAGIVAVALVVGAGVSAPTSDGAELTPAAGFLTVTLHRESVGCAPRAATRGRTTLLVRNARARTTSFVLARHAGGVDTLPRFEGMPFVPSDEIVTRIDAIAAGRQKRLAVRLIPGEYLLIASSSATVAVVEAARSFRVS